VPRKVINTMQLVFKGLLRAPPLVADFVAKVFYKFFRVQGPLGKDII